MAEYREGELLRIVIDGARFAALTATLDVTLIHPQTGIKLGIRLPWGWDAVTVERVAPPEWPPRPGDLWQDRNGCSWFAADIHDIEATDDVEIVLISEGNQRLFPDDVNQRYGPMARVHPRPETTTGGEVAGDG
jgi:hypothetical protein